MSIDILSYRNLAMLNRYIGPTPVSDSGTIGNSSSTGWTITDSTGYTAIKRVPQQVIIPSPLDDPTDTIPQWISPYEEINQSNEKIAKLFKKIYNNLDDIDKAIIKSKLTEEELELLDCL